MKIYVFGNQESDLDNKVFEVMDYFNCHPELVSGSKSIIRNDKKIEFIIVKPNEDLPFENLENILIMDTVQGINKVRLIEDLDNFKLMPRNTVHDFDLGFQLKYLKKLGKINKVKIIGIPQNGKIDYERIQLILRKLVTQDIHGS